MAMSAPDCDVALPRAVSPWLRVLPLWPAVLLPPWAVVPLWVLLPPCAVVPLWVLLPPCAVAPLWLLPPCAVLPLALPGWLPR
jgi:hypothetical protein